MMSAKHGQTYWIVPSIARGCDTMRSATGAFQRKEVCSSSSATRRFASRAAAVVALLLRNRKRRYEKCRGGGRRFKCEQISCKARGFVPLASTLWEIFLAFSTLQRNCGFLLSWADSKSNPDQAPAG